MSPAVRRRTRFVFVSLVAGLFLTWGVAWLGALAPNTMAPWSVVGSNLFQGWVNTRCRLPQHTQVGPHGGMMIDWDGWLGLETVCVGPLWSSSVPSPFPAEWREIYPSWEDVPTSELDMYSRTSPDLPRWVEIPPADTHVRSLITHAAGWPMPALSCREDVFASPSHRVMKGAWAKVGVRGYPLRWVPLVPMPLGFAVDVMFWTVFVIGVFFGLTRSRAWLRRRRGLCPGCAYHRAGLPDGAKCPECGLAASSYTPR